LYVRIHARFDIYSVLTENDLSGHIASLGKNGGRQDPWQDFTSAQLINYVRSKLERCEQRTARRGWLGVLWVRRANSSPFRKHMRFSQAERTIVF
jgi:hypothetical protein